jgi:hypothetical protein
LRTALSLAGVLVASFAVAAPASAVPAQGVYGAAFQCLTAGGVFFVPLPDSYGCTVETPASRAVCENAYGGTYVVRDPQFGYAFLCRNADLG